MDKKNLNLIHLLILAAGAVLSIQCVLISKTVRPVYIINIGTISVTAISVGFMAIMIISGIIAFYSLLNMRGEAISRLRGGRAYLIPLSVGIVMSSLGTSIIGLSSQVVSGISISTVVLIGIQVFNLGILSLISFVSQKGGMSCLIKNVPNYSILLFFLLLMPAALIL